MSLRIEGGDQYPTVDEMEHFFIQNGFYGMRFALPSISHHTKSLIAQNLYGELLSGKSVSDKWKTPSRIYHLALAKLSEIEEEMEAFYKSSQENSFITQKAVNLWSQGISFISRTPDAITRLFQEAHARGLLPQLHSLFMENPRRFLLKEDSGISFPYLDICECSCGPFGTHDRYSNPCRISIENAIIENIVYFHPNRDKKLHLVSLGPGEYLQDWMILSRLHQLGYKEARMVFIDPTFFRLSQELKENSRPSFLSPEQLVTLQRIESENLEILSNSPYAQWIDYSEISSKAFVHFNRLDLNKQLTDNKKTTTPNICDGYSMYSLDKWLQMKEYFRAIGLDVEFCGLPSPRNIKEVIPDFQADAVWAIDFDDYQLGAWATFREAIRHCSSSATSTHISIKGFVLGRSTASTQLALRGVPESLDLLLQLENLSFKQEKITILMNYFSLEFVVLAVLTRLLHESPQVASIEIIFNDDWADDVLTSEFEKELSLYSEWLKEFFRMSLSDKIQLSCRLVINREDVETCAFIKDLKPDIICAMHESLQDLEAVAAELREIPKIYGFISCSEGIYRKNPQRPEVMELIPSVQNIIENEFTSETTHH